MNLVNISYTRDMLLVNIVQPNLAQIREIIGYYIM